MKILITGASGLLGSHLVEQALKNKFEVHVLTRGLPRRSALSSFKNQFHLVEGDLQNPTSLKNVGSFEAVIHAAGFASSRAEDQEKMRLVNIEGTQNLCEALGSKCRKFVFISSIATLSDGSGKRVSEENVDHGRKTIYATTKRAAEKIVEKNWPLAKNLIFHPTYLIDKYDSRPSSAAILFGLRMKKIKHFLEADKNIAAARDVANGILSALAKEKSGRYILGGQQMSISRFFQLSLKSLGMSEDEMPEKISSPQGINETEADFIKEFCINEKVSSDKAKKEFGYQPTADISIALNDCVDWLVSQRMLKRGAL